MTSPSLQLLLQECGPSLSSQPEQVLSSLRRYSDSMPKVVPSKALAEAELAGRNGWFLRAAARAGRAQPRHRALLSEVGVAAPADDGGDLGGDLAEEELSRSTSPSPRNEGGGGAESAPPPSQRQSPTVVWRHGFGLRLLAASHPTQPPPPTPTSTPPTPRSAVVVGAGIVGSAVALELARRGLQVTVLDQRGDPAAFASTSASASAPPPEPSKSSASSSAPPPPPSPSPSPPPVPTEGSKGQCTDERCVDATSGSFAWLNANGKDSISAPYGALNRLGMGLACRSWHRARLGLVRSALPWGALRASLASFCRLAPLAPRSTRKRSLPSTATFHRPGLAMWRRVPPYEAVACWGDGALVASTAAVGEDAGGAYAVAHDLNDAEVASLEPLLDVGGGRSDTEGGDEGGGSVSGGGEVGAFVRRSHHLHHYLDEGSVCPRAATAALCEAARVEGATFLWDTAVTSILAGPSAATSATAATTEVDTNLPPDTDAATSVTAARAVGVRATDGQGASFEVRADVVVLAAGVGLGRHALGASVPMLHSPGRLVHLAPRTAVAATAAAATTAAAAATGVVASAVDGTSALDCQGLNTLFVDTLGGVHALQRADGTCVVGGDLSGYAMRVPCVCHALP